MSFRKLFRGSARGFSFIEQAMVIPIVLAVILGSVDVTNYFRAQNAVKEGVHEGLRCLYPSDGDCITASAPESLPVNDLFVPPFFALHHDYDGREDHLVLPNYAFGSINARTLNEVRFNINSQRYGIKRDLYPATALVQAVLETRPRVGGGSPTMGRISGGIPVGFSGAPRGEQASCATADSDEISIGSLEFHTPQSPVASMPYITQIDDKIEYSSTLRVSRSSHFNSGTDLGSFFVSIHGTGYAYNSETRTTTQNGNWHGHVEMKFQVYENGNWKTVKDGGNLKGRDFDSAPAQNLVPRGFWPEETHRVYSTEDWEHYRPEFTEHFVIKAPFSARARINFTLRGARGRSCHPNIRIGWDLTSAQIVMSQYQVIEDLLACSGNLSRSECGQPCAINRAESTFFAQLGDEVGPAVTTTCATTPTSSDSPRYAQTCSSTEPSLVALTQALGIPAHLAGDYSFVPPQTNGCPTSESKSCGANFGVSTPSLQDSNGFYVVNSPEAQSICPIPAYGVQGTGRWSEQNQAVYTTPIYQRESDCSIRPGTRMPDYLIPAEVRPYKKPFYPSAQLASSGPSYRFPGDPDELVNTAQFNCPEVGIGRLHFDENHMNSFEEPMRSELRRSLFNGAHEQLGCSVEDALRQEAIRIGMNPSAHFEVTKNVSVPDTETQISHTKVDSCVVARADTSLMTTNLRSKVPGGPYFENHTPNSCVINGVNYCIRIPAGVREVEPHGEYTVNVQEARNRAVRAIEAFMPSGKTDPACDANGGADCVRIQFLGNTDPETFDPLTEDFHMRASIDLPLLMLGNEPMTISYEATRAWEGKYTK